MPRTKKVPTGLLAERNPVRLVALASLHGRRTFFLLTLLQLRSPRTPRERENISGTVGNSYPQLGVDWRLSHTLYLHNLIRSGKAWVPLGQENRVARCAIACVCGVRRPDGGGPRSSNLI